MVRASGQCSDSSAAKLVSPPCCGSTSSTTRPDTAPVTIPRFASRRRRDQGAGPAPGPRAGDAPEVRVAAAPEPVRELVVRGPAVLEFEPRDRRALAARLDRDDPPPPREIRPGGGARLGVPR